MHEEGYKTIHQIPPYFILSPLNYNGDGNRLHWLRKRKHSESISASIARRLVKRCSALDTHSNFTEYFFQPLHIDRFDHNR
jgi:hypothetical protein